MACRARARIGALAALALALVVVADASACTRPTQLRATRPRALLHRPCPALVPPRARAWRVAKRRAARVVAVEYQVADALDAESRASQAESGRPAASGRTLSHMLSVVAAVITAYVPAWILLASVAGLKAPGLFGWFTAAWYTPALGVMMLCTALTLELDDFARVFASGKKAVACGVLSHVLLKPPLALGLGRALALPAAAVSGLVLLSAAPGAQAASVAVLLARGNVAVSVTIVTALNLLAFLLTPALFRLTTGGTVVVDALGISRTTGEVVLLPVVLGLLLNRTFPGLRARLSRAAPALASVIATVFAGSGVAMIAPLLSTVTPRLYLSVLGFHVLGSAAGYGFGRLCSLGPRDLRVLAIQGGMQSSSLAFLLATRHLADGGSLGAVPSALSVGVMLLWGMTLANVMRRTTDPRPMDAEALALEWDWEALALGINPSMSPQGPPDYAAAGMAAT